MKCAMEVLVERQNYLEALRIAEEKRKADIYNKNVGLYLNYRPILDKKIEEQLIANGKATINIKAISYNENEVFYGTIKHFYYANGKCYHIFANEEEIILLDDYIKYLESCCYNVVVENKSVYVYASSTAKRASMPKPITTITITFNPNCIA